VPLFLLPAAARQLKSDPLGGGHVSSARLGALFAIATAAATSSTLQAQVQLTDADSVVLERSACFGTCPAYRLSLSRLGQVVFVSHNRQEQGRRETGSIPAQGFDRVLRVAVTAAFLELPTSYTMHSSLCPTAFTDAPTATVTVFMPRLTKQVVDYHGCGTVPADLRTLELVIDSVAGVARWVRPNRLR